MNPDLAEFNPESGIFESVFESDPEASRNQSGFVELLYCNGGGMQLSIGGRGGLIHVFMSHRNAMTHIKANFRQAERNRHGKFKDYFDKPNLLKRIFNFIIKKT